MPPKRKSSRNAEGSSNKKQKTSELKHGLEWGTVGEGQKAPYIAPLLVLSSDTLPGKERVIGFDIDCTLIATKSGRKFATGK